MNKYSVTSNTVKLLKHLDTLKGLQEGKVSPIMVHFLPTHRCQLDCIHCCFKNRKDKKADIPFEWFWEAFKQFLKLGTTSWELSGGGEPTLWPDINKAMECFHDMGCHVGIITNGLGGDKVRHWEWFDWVRVSLNTLDYKDDLDLGYLKDTRISFCYIWNEHSRKRFPRVAEFAKQHKTICRVAPDCIVSTWHIEKQISAIRETLLNYEDNRYIFLSDFNVQIARRNHDCRIHMIKPCFYVDGWVYSCPSAELAVENDKQIQPKTRVCRYDEIYEWYTSPEAMKSRILDCSYCKYAKTQEFLEDLLTETEFNEFA